ncbi:MAG: hypothetical protein K8R21_04525 [Leptospira sp.]|nr:hypothetical protein [Leptospira sp.]
MGRTVAFNAGLLLIFADCVSGTYYDQDGNYQQPEPYGCANNPYNQYSNCYGNSYYNRGSAYYGNAGYGQQNSGQTQRSGFSPVKTHNPFSVPSGRFHNASSPARWRF